VFTSTIHDRLLMITICLTPPLFVHFCVQYGGFSKFPGQLPDLYHSYYGYTAFSLLEEQGLSPLCPELGLPLLAAPGIWCLDCLKVTFFFHHIVTFMSTFRVVTLLKLTEWIL